MWETLKWLDTSAHITFTGAIIGSVQVCSRWTELERSLRLHILTRIWCTEIWLITWSMKILINNQLKYIFTWPTLFTDFSASNQLNSVNIAGFASLLNRINRPEVTIGVDGTLFRYHHYFNHKMYAMTKKMLNNHHHSVSCLFLLSEFETVRIVYELGDSGLYIDYVFFI